jgi:hypothetical protein
MFFQWMQPSLDGRTDQHIAADTGTYTDLADAIREGRPNPFVIAALAKFPNNLWMPVLLAIAFRDPLAIVIVNYLILFLSIFLLKKTFSLSMGTFIALLLLNPTTTVSLLSLNKEIIDLLGISLFLYARSARLKGLLLFALLIAVVNRYEVCVFMLLYLFVTSSFCRWHAQRIRMLLLIVLAIDIFLPFFGSASLEARFAEASNGGLIALLDSMEIHYLYFVAVVPKIAENLFAELFSVSKWMSYEANDLANSYVVGFNNLANAIVFLLLLKKRRLSIRNNLIYFAMLGSVVMALAMVVQPRYFYCVYILLCLQVAEAHSESESDVRIPSLHSDTAHA